MEVFGGPEGFTKVREADRKKIFQFSSQKLRTVPSYDQSVGLMRDFFNFISEHWFYKQHLSDFPVLWRVQEAPGGLLDSFPPILVPLRLHGTELWSNSVDWGILYTNGYGSRYLAHSILSVRFATFPVTLQQCRRSQL